MLIPAPCLTLSRLRRSWSAKERARFFGEVQAFQTPDFMDRPLPSSVVAEPVLFERPILRDIDGGSATRADRGFECQYWKVTSVLGKSIGKPSQNWLAGCLRLVHKKMTPRSRFVIVADSSYASG